MNPYRPGQPAPPESFAGRADLLTMVGEALASARSPAPASSALLLHGHRGSGKTSAIRKVESAVTRENPGAVVVEIQLLAASDDERLLQLLLDNIRTQSSASTPMWKRVREFLKRVSAVSTPFGGIEVSEARATTPTTSQALWRSCMSALEGAPVLFVAIDDADYLDDEGLGLLKTIAESPASPPVFMAVAGGPPLMEKMGHAHLSPVARVFSGTKINLGELSERETRDALDAPLRSSGAASRWADSGVRRIFEYSHGHPYLVQCLAFAAFRERGVMDAAGVDGALEKALEAGEEWLARTCAAASDGDIRAFYKIARSGRSSFRAGDLRALGVPPTYVKRLVDAGVLKKVSHAHYDVAMAPVVAYYHSLVRRLPLE